MELLPRWSAVDSPCPASALAWDGACARGARSVCFPRLKRSLKHDRKTHSGSRTAAASASDRLVLGGSPLPAGTWRLLPGIPFDTDEVVPAIVSPHARIAFDGNRYSAPPEFARRTITIRANRAEVRLLHEGQVVGRHVRSYERGQLLVLPGHRLAALTLRQRPRQQALERDFDAWGPEARAFRLHLNRRPVKTSVQLRRLLNLAQVYGRTEVLAAMARVLELAAGDNAHDIPYDAAHVENLLLAERRRRQLHTPTLPAPKRQELIDDIDLEPPDPAFYDRFCHDTEPNTEEESHGTT